MTIHDVDRLPTVTTGAATAVSTSGATLHGTVNPEGKESTYHFEYGTSTTYGASTPDRSAGSGTTDQPSSAALDGLVPATTYHFRIVATSAAGGPVLVADQIFTTDHPVEQPPSGGQPQQAPDVTTQRAGRVGRTSATLHGTVNPQGLPTSYHFDYGPTTAYGAHTARLSLARGSTPTVGAGSGNSAQDVSARVSGLDLPRSPRRVERRGHQLRR